MDVFQLLALFANYNKVGQTGRNCCEKTFRRTVNKQWGPAITGFFYSRHESEKTLCQLVHFMSSCFCYFDACQLVNVQVVEQILLGYFTHLGQYKTRTIDWLGLEADTSLDIIFACLSAGNLHYSLFG